MLEEYRAKHPWVWEALDAKAGATEPGNRKPTLVVL